MRVPGSTASLWWVSRRVGVCVLGNGEGLGNWGIEEWKIKTLRVAGEASARNPWGLAK